VSPARRLATIVAVGLATGALTQLGQGILPGDWSQAANAISPWLLVAFLLGSTMPDRRWAGVAGIGALAFALVGYYGMVQLRFGYSGAPATLLFWGIGALVGGVVFGLTGHTWRTGSHRWRALAIGLVAAAFIAEGVYLLNIRPEVLVGFGFMIAGAIVPIVLGRSRADRLGGYVAIVPALALGALGYVAFLALYAVTTGVG
jgi:hypothetical protein